MILRIIYIRFLNFFFKMGFWGFGVLIMELDAIRGNQRAMYGSGLLFTVQYFRYLVFSFVINIF